MNSIEEYKKEIKDFIIVSWCMFFFLIIAAGIWIYFGGQKGPYVLLFFAFFYSAPVAIRRMMKLRSLNNEF